MAYQPVELIEVRAWGTTVGAVTRDPATDFYAFEYAPEWLVGGIELAPLHLPNRAGVFTFPDLNPQTFSRLPALLADALPDYFGNALVTAWLAEQGVPAEQITPLDRLAYLGERGMGALTFHPPTTPSSPPPTALQLADLVTAARSALRGDLADAPSDAVQQLIAVGTSAAGARAKAVVAFNPTTSQLRSGQVDNHEGFEHWLIKLDGVDGDPTREPSLRDGGGYGRIEYAYALMARAAGISIADCHLLPEGPRAHFMTRRFDRGLHGERHHLLTLCAMAHLDFNLARVHSYSQYLDTIDALALGADTRAEAFRRAVFNVAAVNRDDHTKNLAFLLPEGSDWQLAPAYDLIFAHNPSGQWTATHQMGINGKFASITRADLETFGDRHRVPGYREVISQVLDAVDRWPDFAEQAGVSTDRISNISTTLSAARPQ